LIHKLLVALDKNQLRRLVLVLAGTLVAGMLEMMGIGAIPAFVGLLVEPDRLLSALPAGQFADWIRQIDPAHRTLYGAGLLAGLFLLKNIYLTALIYAEIRLTQDVTASVSTRLFHAYLYSPYPFHLRRNPAELTRNLTEESNGAVQFIKGGMRLVRDGLVLAVVFLLMILADPLVSAAVLLLLTLSSGGFYLVVRGALTKQGQLYQDHWSQQVQIINQSLGAIKDAKILGHEPHLMKLFCREVNCLRQHETFYEFVSALPRYFLEALSVAAVVPVAAAFMMLDRPVQSMLPILALFGVAAVRLVPAISSVNMALVDIRYKRPAFELVCAELEALEFPIAQMPGETANRPQIQKLQKSIRLENIRYCYPDAPAEALQGLSLSIAAGEAVAFIGTSGTGKSTLIDIMLGLLTPTSGQVQVDGLDIQQNLPAWQRQIGYIPQDIYLIDDSICRNIAFGLPDNEINDIALARAIQAAQMEGFVRSLPDGLETLVGNRGIRLSGGQRQRIGIARALYHDPSVLVMDEATSALDDETEREVIGAIGRLRGDRTIIMIAHRLTTVRNCDRLYLLDAGKVKDQGSFGELTKRHAHLRESSAVAVERKQDAV
jgi:ABC-type multidrug transport system fused ATPase/permease subunit